MRRQIAIAAFVAVASVASAAELRADLWPGIENVRRSEENYMLQCRGCHRPDGGGSPDTAPRMAGEIAGFLKVNGGREYLARVPGFATAPLTDAELSDLLNWTLYRFDGASIPADFVPYTPAEVARLRHSPLRVEAKQIRANLIDEIKKTSRRGGRAG